MQTKSTRRNSKIAKLQKWKIEKIFLFCCQPFNNENADQKHRNIATKIIEFKFAKCNKIEVLNTKQKTENTKHKTVKIQNIIAQNICALPSEGA